MASSREDPLRVMGRRVKVPDPKPMFGFPIGPWHDYFAWWPVKTYDNRTIWFQWVKRRCIQANDWIDTRQEHWFQYSVYDHE